MHQRWTALVAVKVDLHLDLYIAGRPPACAHREPGAVLIRPRPLDRLGDLDVHATVFRFQALQVLLCIPNHLDEEYKYAACHEPCGSLGAPERILTLGWYARRLQLKCIRPSTYIWSMCEQTCSGRYKSHRPVYPPPYACCLGINARHELRSSHDHGGTFQTTSTRRRHLGSSSS